MAKTVIVHVLNQDPFVAEMEDLPDPKSSFIAFSNPRKRDGKAVTFIEKGAKLIMFPWNQLFFVEVMESAEERRQIVDFFRES
jgi:hypothetical protein